MQYTKYSLQVKDSIFYYNDPENSIITIEAIAHALSGINRYNGHSDIPFTVCQHSLFVDYLMEKNNESIENRINGLAHDFEEYVVSDVTRPMKQYMKDILHFDYNEYANRVTKAIYKQLNIPGDPHNNDLIKYYDNWALYNEKTYIFTENQKWDWEMEVLPLSEISYFFSLSVTRKEWAEKLINKFNELKIKLGK